MGNQPSQSSPNGGMSDPECHKMIRRALRTPMAKFLTENLQKAGCGVGDNFFRACDCDKKNAGYYAPGEGITVCCNHLKLQDEVNQVIIHELIYAYDDCRAKSLNLSICAHHACSAIRANNLSGDCHFKRELLRGHTNFRGHGQECVKRRALRSVMANRNCSEVASKDAIDAVWDICYSDTTPFDRVP